LKTLIPSLFALLLASPTLPAQGETPKPATKEAPAAKAPPVFRARHILIPWKGNSYAPPDVTRSKDEARELAEQCAKDLKAGKADFGALARQNSSCPSRFSGGDLGQFGPGMMVPEFEKAVLSVKPGEITGPIETMFGFHVIERLPVGKPWPQQIACSHILISYKGAMRAAPEVTRTVEEARALAEKVLAEIKTGKTSFEEAAKKNSDDKFSGANGGSMGTVPARNFAPPFVDGVVALEIGSIGGPVETPFGFHIIRRDKVDLPYRASHILIPWKGAMRAPGDVTRSKEEALALAKKILAELRNGGDFAALARKESSCPSKARGGDLGVFRKGQMVPAFEQAVEKAKVGSIVGPVETPFGYHIIKRVQ